MKNILAISTLLLVNLTCGRTVQRLMKDSDVVDLSGDWSHVDYVESSNEIANTIGKSDWIERFASENKTNPRIMVDEVITKIFTKMINPEDLSSQIEITLADQFQGRVKIIAGGAFRERIRKERMSQQYSSSPETKAKMAAELGANVMITSMITEDVDQKASGFFTKKQQYKVYKVIVKAINVQTSELLWSKIISLKKHIKG